MKGILLAGGSGTRLSPLTIPICKQLLPVYDKPMIYYPLYTLISMGIKEILIISTEKDINRIQELFQDGKKYGIDIYYKVQDKPNGLPEAFILGKDFIKNDNVCLILGDNIFYSSNIDEFLIKSSINFNKGATIFGKQSNTPEKYGVIDFDKKNNVISIHEKPNKPKSNYIVTGIYIFDNKVSELSLNLKYSKRNELEMSDLLNTYLANNDLKVNFLENNVEWFDTGNFNSLLEASNFISDLEIKTGKKVSCIEELAYKLCYINKSQFEKLIKPFEKSDYGKYLMKLLED